jgi:hypothetical protein
MAWQDAPAVTDGAPQSAWASAPAVDAAPAQPAVRDESHTTASGLAASAARGVAPYATGAAIGAAVGAPFAGVGAIPGAAAGAGAVALTEFATGLYDRFADAFGWPRVATPQEKTDRLLDIAGVKRPTTGVERTTETTAAGLSGASAGAAGAKVLADVLAPGAGKGIAETMAASPGKQALSGALGGAAAQGTAEAGGGPLAQFVASTAAGLLPGVKPGAEAALKPSPRVAQPAIKTAIGEGYVFPPAEIPKLGDRPGVTTAALAGEAGKIKLQQEASTRNQVVTNRLAAQDISLPPDTPLTEAAFDQARQAPAAVYNELAAAVPEVTYSPGFKAAAAKIGGPGSLAEEFYPSTATSPEIRALRGELAAHDSAPTPVVMKYIADLRFNANQNLKTVGDAQKHRLGLAQREAADLVEDELGNFVKNAPAHYAGRVKNAQAELKAMQANSATVPPYTPYGMELARQEAAKVAEIASYQKLLTDATAKGSALSTLPDRFQAARQMFAKIYDVEAATNQTTGDVSARGLARVYNKGKPFTGGLKTIADAANASPKSMQMPSLFGRAEDWSALDFFGTATAALHGHPVVAAGIAARPFVRQRLLSERYQRGMIGAGPPGDTFSPLPLVTQPFMNPAIPPNLQNVFPP